MNANATQDDVMMCSGTDTSDEGKILVDAREAAELLGVSLTTWRSLYRSGKTPKPIRLGRRILWKREEIKGCVDKVAKCSEEKILISDREAAELLGISRTTWWSLFNSGRTPKEIRLGRRILWRLEELKDWVDEGCPSRYNWEWKGAGV